MQEEASTRGITIETTWRHAPAVISMDVNKLQQAFINLIKNAMESITKQKAKFILRWKRKGKIISL